MTNNLNLDLTALDTLSPNEREYALKILQEISQGNMESYNNLVLSEYKEAPVDIETFLHDPLYLGKGLYTEEGKFTVFPYWVDTLKKLFPNNIDTNYNTLVLSGGIGLGKAQPLNSLVLTEDGYKKMGELTLNDRVYSNDGKLHKIIGIFPQGVKKICKVSFNDGTSTLCCDEHLWTVYNIKSQKWTTVETKELISGRNLKRGFNKPWNSHRYKIPLTSPIEFNSKNVYIPPYTMGALIGDGSLTHNHVHLTSADSEILDRVCKELNDGYALNHINSSKYDYSICKVVNNTEYDVQRHTQVPAPNKYVKAVKEYGLNVTSEKKFIPKDYLYTDVQSRIALLQGLMDTDGYISKDGSIIEFTTVSEQLKNDFIFLVQSLGGVCKVRIKHPKYRNKDGEILNGALAYSIGTKVPKTISPFFLSRKAARISQKAFEPSRYIESIEYVGEEECQCIYIDAESHLYLTNDFIVTHNTLMAVLCMLYMLYRMLCLKNPYVYYGLQEIDHITFSFMNITMDAAKGVAWSKLQELIQTSPWFMAHGRISKGLNPEWQPVIDKGEIELICGSHPRHVIGRAVFCSFEDEVDTLACLI